MAMNKEEAEARYAEAQEKATAANEELLAARRELDGFLAEEEAQRAAIFLGFEEGDEVGIQAAKAIAQRRREQKAVLKERADVGAGPSGEIGGVS